MQSQQIKKQIRSNYFDKSFQKHLPKAQILEWRHTLKSAEGKYEKEIEYNYILVLIGFFTN